MKKCLHIWVLLCCLFAGPLAVFGQMQVTPSSNLPLPPANLIGGSFVGSGIEVLNVQYIGDPLSLGQFTDAQADIGITNGLVLSTGYAALANGPNCPIGNCGNTNGGFTGNTSGTSDADLQQLGGFNTNDAAVIIIDFVPMGDTLVFNYVFASEEYPEYSCSVFNDVFGFFLSGPGISGPYDEQAINIALLPDTDIPISINNVHGGLPGKLTCPPTNAAYYIANPQNPDNVANLQFDGFTTVLQAKAIVSPCANYRIKLAIADAYDSAFDSAVFLAAESFGTLAYGVQATTDHPDNVVAEGCAEAMVYFALPSPAIEDVSINYSVGGSATPGLDYPELPGSFTIPAGSTVAAFPVSAFEDGLAEGLESIELSFANPVCSLMITTLTLFIAESPPLAYAPFPDVELCPGENIQLYHDLSLPLPSSFAHEIWTPIPDTDSLNVLLLVEGVVPNIVSEGVIASVCVDISHPWLDDLDLFLVAPNGQWLELSTDNGSAGDDELQLCFSPDASQLIDSITPWDPPFTGYWQPEGDFAQLYGAPTNGLWALHVVDDLNGFAGALNAWSITFNTVAAQTYAWSPSEGLSCADCPNPVAEPSSSSTYVVEISNGYNCTLYDTIVVAIAATCDEACPVQWVNAVNVQVAGNDLSKTGASAWDAGASSAAVFAPGVDAWASTLVAESNTARIFGLSASDADATPASIQYGLLLRADSFLQVYENGEALAILGTYASGDVLKIARQGGTVRYYQNGNHLASASQPSLDSLRVDVSLFGANATLQDVQSSCPASTSSQQDLPSGRISVYPNPFHTALWVDASDLGEPLRQVDLYDVAGRALVSFVPQGSGPVAVPVADLPAGLYVLRLNGQWSYKVLKTQP